MDGISQLANWLAASSQTVVFTGAGMSTESGIPDFRSPGGIWATSTPVQYDDFLHSASARYEYWRQKAASHVHFTESSPNAGHRILAKWEEAGIIDAVVTQNIDGLHQLAGSRRVLELHGTAREIECLKCRRRWPADPWVKQFLQEDAAPCCPDCGGLLKHATISFGQSLPEDVLSESFELAQSCDLLLAVGSSLVVEPAASIPRLAKECGAKLVILNRDPTPLNARADAVLSAGIGTALSRVDEVLTGRVPSDPSQRGSQTEAKPTIPE